MEKIIQGQSQGSQIQQLSNSISSSEDRINRVLEFVGLNKNERIIYIDLIKNGVSTALEISKRTKIHRPNTYDSLRKLIENGFASETKTDIKHSFHAVSPERLKDYIHQKAQEADEVILLMKDFTKNLQTKEDFWITKGPFALREALLDLVKIGKPIKVYGLPEGASESLGMGFIKELHKERVKKKVLMQHIYNNGAKSRIMQLNRMKYTEAKSLKKEFDSEVATFVCDDNVLLTNFHNNTTMIIKSQDIAHSYAKYFEILWKNAS